MEVELIYSEQDVRITEKEEPPAKTKYKVGNLLGQGSYGEVFLATDEKGSKFAVKKISKKACQLSKINEEVSACKQVQGSRNVPDLLEAMEDEQNYYLVFELIEGRDLLRVTMEKKGFDESVAKILFSKMINTLSDIHGRGVIHHDLKLENILYCEKNQEPYIIDFGLSTLLNEGTDLCYGDPGSYEYIAPEKIFRKTTGYDGFKSDIWSLGVILYAMVFAKFPWSKTDRTNFIKEKLSHPPFELREHQRKKISAKLSDLMFNMLETDPSKRISLEQIQGHPWLKA